jgi:hypothetical protein
VKEFIIIIIINNTSNGGQQPHAGTVRGRQQIRSGRSALLGILSKSAH